MYSPSNKNKKAQIYYQDRKIKNAVDQQVITRSINYLLTEGKAKCEQIESNTNNEGHKYFGKDAFYFKTKKELEEFLVQFNEFNPEDSLVRKK